MFATINQAVSLVTSFKLHVISMTEGAEIDSLPLKIQDIQIQLSVQGKACHGDFFFRITVCCSIVKGRQSQKVA